MSEFAEKANMMPDRPASKQASEKKRERKQRIPSLAAITSTHRTHLPGIDPFLTLTGSFGPGIIKQPGLWLEGEGFYLTTPRGQVWVEGQSGPENKQLQHYVTSELGPEGLKHLTALIEVYDHLTQGVDQKLDVVVAAKQVLQRMGRGEHADDVDEQENLVRTASYVSHSTVTVVSSKQQRTSPLLILEGMYTEESEIFLKFHLGAEFYKALYGDQKQFYVIPTGQIIGYHSVKSQHELLLTFYLGNRLAVSQGEYAVSFLGLCVESGLYTLERLQLGEKNRMRDAQQILAALERMEIDGLIRRLPHPDIDLIHAVVAYSSPQTEKQLAPATRERIKPMLKQMKGLQTRELNAKRRNAFQRMLYTGDTRALDPGIANFSQIVRFQAGDLLSVGTLNQLTEGVE